jgi:predicted aspartyl protease
MVDTGAGMSIMSYAVARAHGLHVKPYSGTFCVASGTHAKITGEVDAEIQVHRYLALRIEGIKI